MKTYTQLAFSCANSTMARTSCEIDSELNKDIENIDTFLVSLIIVFDQILHIALVFPIFTLNN